MKDQIILQAYHRTHTAKELAAILNVKPLYVRQRACKLRKDGYDIPKSIHPIGTTKYYQCKNELRGAIKTNNGWSYLPKQTPPPPTLKNKSDELRNDR